MIMESEEEYFIKYATIYLRAAKDTSYHVLAEIFDQCSPEGEWLAIKSNKEIIKQKLFISSSTLDKHIKSLKERGILSSKMKSLYTIEAFNLYELED